MTHTDHLPSGGIRRFLHELREGARRQGNVVFALIFREIKNRGGQDNYGLLTFLGIVLEPAIGVAVLSAFWYVIRRQDIQGVHVALFLTVGLTGFTIMRRGMATIPKSVRTSKSFFSFPNVKPFDAILARFTIELVLTMLGGAIMLFVLWWFLDLTIGMNKFLEGMGVFGLLCVAAFGISLFLGVYGTRFPAIMTAISFSGRALLILSAVIHPASELPVQAQYYLAWNPIAHGLELMRYYFLGMKPFQIASMTYLAGFAVIMLCLGFMSYYANRQKVIER